MTTPSWATDAVRSYSNRSEVKAVASELQFLKLGPSITTLLWVGVGHTHTTETLEVCKYHVLTKVSEYTLKLSLQGDGKQGSIQRQSRIG